MTGPFPPSPPGPRGLPGRGNGLVASSYAALGDIDPRTADAVLGALAVAGIAAYVKPSTGTVGGYLDVRLPARPVDRLFVDAVRRPEARAVLDAELAETAELPTRAGRARASDDAAFSELVAHWDDPVDERSWPAAEELTPIGEQPVALFGDPLSLTDPRQPVVDDDEPGQRPAGGAGRSGPTFSGPPRTWLDPGWTEPDSFDASGYAAGGRDDARPWWVDGIAPTAPGRPGSTPGEATPPAPEEPADDEDGPDSGRPIADLRGLGRRDLISGGPRHADDAPDPLDGSGLNGSDLNSADPNGSDLNGADLNDEEHYEPPPPPPLPRVQTATKWAIVSMLFGVLLLLAPALLGLEHTTAVHAVAVLAVLAGAATLVARMRDEPPDWRGPDDGAVV